MAGRETADIVFCMDASGSMNLAFDGVRENVFKMLETIRGGGLQQRNWDVRFDFLAYSNSSTAMRLETLNKSGIDVIHGLYGDMQSCQIQKTLNQKQASGDFFTSDVEKFKDRLKSIDVDWDEASAYALDICADFPFRDASSCHRVVVFMTDETIDEGIDSDRARNKIMDLAKKYQDKKIALYMITPECDVFDMLSQIDKCEWTVDGSRGLTAVDFTKTLQGIGKSVSVSQTSSAGLNESKPLFRENEWKPFSERHNFVEVVK